MKWKFWEKPAEDQTEISITAKEGGINQIYVKAQTSEKALELFKKLREEVKEK